MKLEILLSFKHRFQEDFTGQRIKTDKPVLVCVVLRAGRRLVVAVLAVRLRVCEPLKQAETWGLHGIPAAERAHARDGCEKQRLEVGDPVRAGAPFMSVQRLCCRGRGFQLLSS